MNIEEILNSLSEDKKTALQSELDTIAELKANGIIEEDEYRELEKKTVDSFMLEFKADVEDSSTADPVVGAGGAAKKRKADMFKSNNQSTADTVPDLAGIKDGNLLDVSTKQTAPRLADKRTGTGVKEHTDNLFGSDESLSEEFKVKAAAVFEAAVIEKVEEETSRLQEEFDARLQEEISILEEKMDEYLDYVVENFLEENKIAIESSAKVAVAESFMESLKGLFEEHNINIDDTEIDVVEELEKRIAELESDLNESVEKNIEFENMVEEVSREDYLETISEGLSDTQKERLTNLSEKISYSDITEFQTKVQSIKENMIVKKKSNLEDQLNEEFNSENANVEPQIDDVMASYVNATSKIFKN